MKINLISKCLVLLCLVGSCAALQRLTTHLSSTSDSLKKISGLDAFNDVSGFQMKNDNPSVFVVEGDALKKGKEPYLRFSIPDFDPSSYKLILKLRARPGILKAGKIRSARGSWDGGVIDGDIITYDISMKDKSTFLWEDNKCYVGVSFPSSIFKPGDTIELLDFKFELR